MSSPPPLLDLPSKRGEDRGNSDDMRIFAAMPSVMVDRSPLDARPTIPTGQLSVKTSRISPERKLWLCIVLQDVAEQDPANVLYGGNGLYRQANRERLAKEAKEWLETEDFADACDRAGIEPEAAKALDPERAQDGLNFLLGNRLPQHSKEIISEPCEVLCAD